MIGDGADMSTEGRPGSASRGANYALQVALQTMKERCQQLQRRLSTIEDENIALRRMVARAGLDDRTFAGPDSLREQVAELSLQKAQLSQQMQMVAAENRQLWLRLSRLYHANQTLGGQLSRISDTLKQHTSSPPPPTTKDIGNAASLEEISLRLANSILQDKLNLEQQCAEITELQQSSPIDLQTLAAEGDENEVLTAHYKRLSEVRDLLRNQQIALKAGIATLRNMESRKQSQEEEQQLLSLREWGPPPCSPDWTCPMCGRHFPSTSVEFDSFQHHVMGHFTAEDDPDPSNTFDFCH